MCRVRTIEPTVWLQQRYVETHQHAYVPLWDEVLSVVDPADVHPDFSTRLLAFALLGLFTGHPYPRACSGFAASDRLGGEAIERLMPLVGEGQLAPHAVVAIGLLRAAARPIRPIPTSRWTNSRATSPSRWPPAWPATTTTSMAWSR